MATLSTHVLDSSTGRPAEGVQITLRTAPGTALAGAGTALAGAAQAVLATAYTDSDGRVRDWGIGELGPGDYQLRFGTGDWFAAHDRSCFYPEVLIAFTVDAEPHYHVPLLLAPYAYSTYRGS